MADLGVTQEDVDSFNPSNYEMCDICGDMTALSDLVEGFDGYRSCPQCQADFGMDPGEVDGPTGFAAEPDEVKALVELEPINTERAAV